MGVELPQLLDSVVLGILNQAREQFDVPFHRLEIHASGTVGIHRSRFRVADADLPRFPVSPRKTCASLPSYPPTR